jgi:hypothetical protein
MAKKIKVNKLLLFMQEQLIDIRSEQFLILQNEPRCLKWETLNSDIINNGLRWHNRAGAKEQLKMLKKYIKKHSK